MALQDLLDAGKREREALEEKAEHREFNRVWDMWVKERKQEASNPDYIPRSPVGQGIRGQEDPFSDGIW